MNHLDPPVNLCQFVSICGVRERVALDLLPPPQSLSRQHGAAQQYWPPNTRHPSYSDRANSVEISRITKRYNSITAAPDVPGDQRGPTLEALKVPFSLLQPWWLATRQSQKEADLTHLLLIITMELDAM